MSTWVPKPGQRVDYIGRAGSLHRELPLPPGVKAPFTAKVTEVHTLPSGRLVVYLEGYEGWFAVDSVMPTPAELQEPPNELPLTDAELDEMELFLQRRPPEARNLGVVHRAIRELRFWRREMSRELGEDV